MLKIPAANLKPVDRYGADQVQFGGGTKSQQGDARGGGAKICSVWHKMKQRHVCSSFPKESDKTTGALRWIFWEITVFVFFVCLFFADSYMKRLILLKLYAKLTSIFLSL